MDKLKIEDINVKLLKDSSIGVRLPSYLKDEISKICKYNKISISDYVIHLILNDLNNRK